MKIKANAKFWDVRYSMPAVTLYDDGAGGKKEYKHNKNYHAMAAAEDAQKVMDLVLAEHPGATIHQINHRGGDCGIFVQPELMQCHA